MKIVKKISELKSLLTHLNNKSELGLVPTMGALHQGHMTLVEKAFLENKIVVVSIFVNPTQFNNTDDLTAYPRTLKEDSMLLKEISDDIIIFAPSVSEIYPNGQKSETYNFNGLENVMEGAYRKGHFNGVATIVERLFLLIKPNNAYFGEKDFQQLQIIRSLVASKKIPVKIVGCPIVRESNGLAKSSRNKRLSKAMKNEASFIYKTLKEAKNRFKKNSANKVLDWGKQQFTNHKDFELEYLIIAESETLKPIKRKKPKTKYILFVAVYSESIRLIDNITLN